MVITNSSRGQTSMKSQIGFIASIRRLSWKEDREDSRSTSTLSLTMSPDLSHRTAKDVPPGP